MSQKVLLLPPGRESRQKKQREGRGSRNGQRARDQRKLMAGHKETKSSALKLKVMEMTTATSSWSRA